MLENMDFMCYNYPYNLQGGFHMSFLLTHNTKIQYSGNNKAVKHAVSMLERDIDKCLTPSAIPKNSIVLTENAGLAAEAYIITITDKITVAASEELGFVYGLLYISEHFLGVKPFWFWLDQQFEAKDLIKVNEGIINSVQPAVKYRGWFLNDEVLIMKWMPNGDSDLPWRMAFEALLRCGGNMVIPGTDKNSRLHRGLASEMGLWITQHHAEPLGAEMFVRAYPGEAPNYLDCPEKFHKLWLDSIKAHKGMKVIWSLGFRGQGDCPFWSHDKSGHFDTDEKRGALISEIIELQRQMVIEYCDNPVFCTNLYGEIMELYEAGHIHFAEDIIKIGADNGFGKMVTRRRENHTVRISSLPKKPEKHGGIYYHVSFYDLQAANHITMLPNSVDFVNAELDAVRDMNAMDYWIINCSNIRPHVYFLDAVRKKWNGMEISDESHSREFAADYYNNSKDAAQALCRYHKTMIAYGSEEDEHAGEQFYNESVRILSSRYMIDKNGTAGHLHWLTGQKPLREQNKLFGSLCAAGLDQAERYYEDCAAASKTLSGSEKLLFDGTILLQAEIHCFCRKGSVLFSNALETAYQEKWLDAFMQLGRAAELFDKANNAMRGSEYGIWQGFYFNECFADVKHTAYMIRKLMGLIRELGEGARHVTWYRLAAYAPEDREVMTLLVNDNHMEDQEVYEALKKAGR